MLAIWLAVGRRLPCPSKLSDAVAKAVVGSLRDAYMDWHPVYGGLKHRDKEFRVVMVGKQVRLMYRGTEVWLSRRWHRRLKKEARRCLLRQILRAG